jgi:hypothetical protein
MIASAKADGGNMMKVLRALLLFADQRSNTLVTARPDEQFSQNSRSSADCRPRAGSAAATMSLHSA